mmetsp:Transcript_6554/g.24592  ORF Transcript_6554/g.24592 Transcript_6554/m.24592 type:complete len:121 (+) Transcript_6554:2076-2438(+)
METYRDTRFHNPLVWRDNIGPCYRFVGQNSSGLHVAEDIPLFEIEDQIIKGYLVAAQEVLHVTFPLIHAVFAMPVYTPMSVRQSRPSTVQNFQPSDPTMDCAHRERMCIYCIRQSVRQSK